MLTRKDLKISTEAFEFPDGVSSAAGVGARRDVGAGFMLSRVLYDEYESFSFWLKVDRPEGVKSDRYDREASVEPLKVFGGEVGDGMFGE
jgi:hypothetical protein